MLILFRAVDPRGHAMEETAHRTFRKNLSGWPGVPVPQATDANILRKEADWPRLAQAD
jgi:hypothetical protein